MGVSPPTPESISVVEKTFPAGLPLNYEAQKSHTNCKKQANEIGKNPYTGLVQAPKWALVDPSRRDSSAHHGQTKVAASHEQA